jgi:hypothetical protein
VRPARLLQSPSTDPPPHSLNIPLAIRCLTLSIFLSRLGADSRQPWRQRSSQPGINFVEERCLC